MHRCHSNDRFGESLLRRLIVLQLLWDLRAGLDPESQELGPAVDDALAMAPEGDEDHEGDEAPEVDEGPEDQEGPDGVGERLRISGNAGQVGRGLPDG